MSEAMEPIHPAHAALLMGKAPEPCEPFVEISSQVLGRLLDVVEFGDQLERVEKDRLLSSVKELLALEQPGLWAIHSVGPNELSPMITKEAAERHATELAVMFTKHGASLGLRFDVIRSPFTPLEHFEILAEEALGHVDNLRAELERLKGITPELPPRPPEGDGLPRYGLRWNGPGLPLAVPMGDGYWTPWHLASKAVDDYSDMLSRTSLECGERLDDMEKRMAELNVLLAEARMVNSACIDECDLPIELDWMCKRASKGRRIYVDDRALSANSEPAPAAEPVQDRQREGEE